MEEPGPLARAISKRGVNMSFNVRFWTFTKKYNSTKRPVTENGTLYNCVIKDGSSVVNPKIELNLGMSENPSAFNYCRIAGFNRYYYIREWSFDKGLWTATLATDVLATYKDEIGAASLYMLRASAEHNGRVVDNLYPCKVNCNFDSTVLSLPYTAGCYVVGVVSGMAGQFGSITYYVLDQANVTKLVKALIEDVIDTSNGFNASDASYALQQSIVDPIQYIKSCIWIPFDASDIVTIPLTIDLEVYGWKFPGVSGQLLMSTRVQKTYTIATKKHPDTNARGNYVNAAPYTKATLNFAPFGTIEIDTTVICDVSQIRVDLDVDTMNGQGVLRVYANDILLNELKTQVAVPVQLTQITRDYLGAAQSAIGGVAGAVGSALSGNVAGAITSAISGIGDSIRAMVPRSQTIGSNGAFSNLLYPPRLDFQFFRPVDDDNAHNGRPLCAIRQVAALGGYMLVQDGDVPIAGTQGEGDAVKALLEGGFYYE